MYIEHTLGNQNIQIMEHFSELHKMIQLQWSSNLAITDKANKMQFLFTLRTYLLSFDRGLWCQSFRNSPDTTVLT